MSEPFLPDGPPVGLVLEIETPVETGAVKITVPLDATVGETTFRVMAQLGVDTPECYELWVAVEAEDMEKDWHLLDEDDILLDGLRGAQHRPKIVPTPVEDPDGLPEGNDP